MKPTCLMFLALLPALALPAADVFARDTDSPTPVFNSCEIGDPNTRLTLRAECATISVPENPNDSNGRHIDLFIARLAARSTDTDEDPVTMIAGGPGQSATESFPAVQFAFEKLRKSRDIYLIDQRGTGKSNRLECPETNTDRDENSIKFDAEEVKQASLVCLNELTGDPRFYTTSIAVDDLEFVRTLLGIHQWNVYGISYGTRVGLHYLRKFPDSIRTLILDAVVPPDVSLGVKLATAAQRALDQMMQRCLQDRHCNESFPDLAKNTKKLLEELKENPRTIMFENFNTGSLETMDFTVQHLTLTLRMLSYSTYGVSILPVLLHNAYTKGNFAPLARQSSLQARNLSDSIAGGMHNSVICTEDQPYINNDSISLEQQSQTYLGTLPVEALNATCSAWPSGVLDAHFKEPVISDKPVLLLSGGADPVTPPEYGDAVAEHLPNALHIVNPGQGHMQALVGCMPDVMNNFVERGNTQDVDFGCLERQAAAPFFIDANGPLP